jgi:hypothetical protein
MSDRGGLKGPDDLPRSPSGRVPQWVLDEQRARSAPPSSSRAHRPRRVRSPRAVPVGPRRSGSWVTAALSVLVAAGVAILAVRGGHLPQAPSAYGDSRPTNIPSAGYEEADHPIGVAPPSGASVSFRYVSTQQDKVTPVAYDPCRPIHYVTRPDAAPPGGDEVIAAAVARASAATGLRFVNDGHTTEGATKQRQAFQPDRYGDRWAPVLFVWETADEQPDFGVDIAGLAGSAPISWGDHPAVYVTGVVQLDAAKLGRDLTQPQGTPRVEAVILHEIGHLLGLDHVNDQAQLMYPPRGHTHQLRTRRPHRPRHPRQRDLRPMALIRNGVANRTATFAAEWATSPQRLKHALNDSGRSEA